MLPDDRHLAGDGLRSGGIFKSISLGGRTIAPALFLAPMAGITNSAFRRLLGGFWRIRSTHHRNALGLGISP